MILTAVGITFPHGGCSVIWHDERKRHSKKIKNDFYSLGLTHALAFLTQNRVVLHRGEYEILLYGFHLDQWIYYNFMIIAILALISPRGVLFVNTRSFTSIRYAQGMGLLISSNIHMTFLNTSRWLLLRILLLL